MGEIENWQIRQREVEQALASIHEFEWTPGFGATIPDLVARGIIEECGLVSEWAFLTDALQRHRAWPRPSRS